MFQQIFKGITVGLLMVLATFVFASSTPTFSQTTLVPDRSRICDGDCPVTGATNIGTVDQNRLVDIIINIARFLTFVGVGLSVLFMVWGGIRYITSQGSAGAEAGKEILINATIGLVVSIVAFTVVSVLATLLSGNVAGSLLEP